MADLEAIIASNPYSSLQYAKTVLRGRFPAGEPAIAEIYHCSWEYAMEIIKDRFPLIEDRIIGNYASGHFDMQDEAGHFSRYLEFLDAVNPAAVLSIYIRLGWSLESL